MENERLEKYLPLGSVIMLKEGKKRLMIIGYCPIAPESKQKLYDYSGCLFPEGMLSSDRNVLFDHSQISKVYCTGLVDEEVNEFRTKLKETMGKITPEVIQNISSIAQKHTENK